MTETKRREKGRKIGRPPQTPGQPKGAIINTRVRSALKRALEERAATTGRSLSGEIEALLEQALKDEESKGGATAAGLFQIMAGSIGIVEARTGKKWDEDWDTSIAVHRAWDYIIAAVAPKPPARFLKDAKAVDRMGIPEQPPRPKSPSLLATPESTQFYEEALAQYEEASAEREAVQAEQKAVMDPWMKSWEEMRSYGKDAAIELFSDLRPRK